MKIEYIEGISADRFNIYKDNGVIEEYIIGYNASWSRESAEYAHRDVINAEKYHWTTPHREKPFIGELLPEGWETAEWTGYNVFMGRDFNEAAIEQVKRDIKEEVGR